NPNYATFGTAAALVTLPGTDPHLAADIATVQGRWGPADLIENQDIATGTTQPVQVRAESPHGHYNSPLLSLVSGTYPAGPGQVALTSQVATLYGAHVGGAWQAVGTTWRVTGIVQDPVPRHAQRDRRDRTQPPPGHDRQRPSRRPCRRAGRGGAGLRRLVRLR